MVYASALSPSLRFSRPVASSARLGQQPAATRPPGLLPSSAGRRHNLRPVSAAARSSGRLLRPQRRRPPGAVRVVCFVDDKESKLPCGRRTCTQMGSKNQLSKCRPVEPATSLMPVSAPNSVQALLNALWQFWDGVAAEALAKFAKSKRWTHDAIEQAFWLAFRVIVFCWDKIEDGFQGRRSIKTSIAASHRVLRTELLLDTAPSAGHCPPVFFLVAGPPGPRADEPRRSLSGQRSKFVVKDTGLPPTAADARELFSEGIAFVAPSADVAKLTESILHHFFKDLAFGVGRGTSRLEPTGSHSKRPDAIHTVVLLFTEPGLLISDKWELREKADKKSELK